MQYRSYLVPDAHTLFMEILPVVVLPCDPEVVRCRAVRDRRPVHAIAVVWFRANYRGGTRDRVGGSELFLKGGSVFVGFHMGGGLPEIVIHSCSPAR